MRKVNIGTIQPAEIAIPPGLRWGQPNYRPDIKAIMQNCILPQAEVTFKLLEEAGEAGCDIVTTCEDLSIASAYVTDTTADNVFPEIVDKSLPIIEDRIASIAKKHNMNIVACYYKPRDGKIYNTASVFDRKGNIAGDYKKTHIPSFELFQVAEGNEVNTIDLDIGRIGVMICYDVMFPALGEALSLKGAEIVFHPTFGYGWNESIGEATLRARANDGSYYLVTSKSYAYNGAGKSSIIDHWGHVLADAAYEANVVVTRKIDLDNIKAQPENFVLSAITGHANMRTRNICERRPDLYGVLTEKNALTFDFLTPGTQQDEYRDKLIKGIIHW